MRHSIAPSSLPVFERKLRSQWATLRAAICEARERVDSEAHAQIAGPVPDIADESFANLLVDMNYAQIARHAGQMRAVEAAVSRIALGTYGVCAWCGNSIPDERLGAYPIAMRCTRCQRVHEHLLPSTHSA
jgi:RNA polymerase-binding transcription factor DksA